MPGLAVFVLHTAMIAAGRLAFGRWVNHVSLYGLVWTLSLGVGALHLLPLQPISATAYLWMGGACLAYCSGAFLLRGTTLAITARLAPSDPNTLSRLSISRTPLRVVVALLTVIAGLSVFARLAAVVASVGSIDILFFKSREVYWLKMEGALPGGLPYVAAGSLAASCLAGAALAARKIGRLEATLPLAVAAALALSTAGRTDLVLAVLLFLLSFALVRCEGAQPRRLRLLAPVMVTLVVFGLISLTRNLGGDELDGFGVVIPSDRSGDLVRVGASLYRYVVGPPVVFSEYLAAGEEQAQWGENTLGPLRNGLARIGFDVEPLKEKYQRAYDIPMRMNVGTWLRELHVDFGPLGVLLAPFLLGAITSIAVARVRYRQSTVWLVVAAHLYVVAALSSFMCATRWGSWWASLLIGIGAAGVLALVEALRGVAIDARSGSAALSD